MRYTRKAKHLSLPKLRIFLAQEIALGFTQCLTYERDGDGMILRVWGYRLNHSMISRQTSKLRNWGMGFRSNFQIFFIYFLTYWFGSQSRRRQRSSPYVETQPGFRNSKRCPILTTPFLGTVTYLRIFLSMPSAPLTNSCSCPARWCTRSASIFKV